MTIVNIRGTSGSGKSTLVKRYLDARPHTPVMRKLSDWKKEKIVGYLVTSGSSGMNAKTFVLGKYETSCGGCDSLSYKGSHVDMEALIREYAAMGYNVLFEGLVVSSTITRWVRIAQDFPNFLFAFMMTPEEECHQRIVARSGREPKRNPKNNMADYNIKYRACMHHMADRIEAGSRVAAWFSDDDSYQALCEALN